MSKHLISGYWQELLVAGFLLFVFFHKKLQHITNTDNLFEKLSCGFKLKVNAPDYLYLSIPLFSVKTRLVFLFLGF
ncbi:MAG TPA: hypothetical protein DCE56_37385 [Cyanobacteria bacterium UBA8553]|nr:hypothetical protein [Cyanobacteria bacterium UBA8553]HAJ58471.1 hypothetical protein [Cyanobacteria bacterium UBA8543]